MADGDARLNATAASLLGFLQQGPLTGYELVRVADVLIGDFWSLTRSQVYRELAELASRGLVTEGEAGARARRPYRITEAGREAFTEWLARSPGPEQIRYPLLLTMSFGRSLDLQRLLDFLDEHEALHADRLAGYEGKRQALDDPYLEAVLAFGIHYERAVLAWAKEARDLLRSASPPKGRRRPR